MADGQGTSGHREGVGHIVPLWLLVAAFVSLVTLTVATVLAARVDLGAMNIWIALGIASCKSTLVALFFMHLRWDNPFNGIILFGSLLFVALFLGLALMDTVEYQVEMIPGPAPAFQE